MPVFRKVGASKKAFSAKAGSLARNTKYLAARSYKRISPGLERTTTKVKKMLNETMNKFQKSKFAKQLKLERKFKGQGGQKLKLIRRLGGQY